MSLVLLSIFCVTHAKQSRPPELIDKGLSLVYAKVTDICVKKDDKREMQFSTFRITHVYCGDRKLKGQTFFLPLKSVLEQQLDGGPKLVTPFPWVKKDEEGVWCVHNEKWHDERYQGKRAPALFVWDYPLPARKGIDDPNVFSSAVTFAKTVEAINQAADCDKYHLLERAVRSPNWGTVTWAVSVIYRNDPNRLVRMVRDELTKDAPSSDHIRHLVKQLDAEAFKRREAATKELVCIGLDAVPALCQAMACSPPPEVRRRVTAILRDIDCSLHNGSADSPSWNILRVISQQRSAKAERVLQGLKDIAQKHPKSWLNLEIHALMRLAKANRVEIFGQSDHWNSLEEIYWGKSDTKKPD